MKRLHASTSALAPDAVQCLRFQPNGSNLKLQAPSKVPQAQVRHQFTKTLLASRRKLFRHTIAQRWQLRTVVLTILQLVARHLRRVHRTSKAQSCFKASSKGHAEQLADWCQQQADLDEVSLLGMHLPKELQNVDDFLILLEHRQLCMQAAAFRHQYSHEHVLAHSHGAKTRDWLPATGDNSTQAWDVDCAYAQPFADIADASNDAQHERMHAHAHAQTHSIGVPPAPQPTPPPRGHGWRVFGLGAIFAIVLQFVVGWLSVSPVWERFFGRFVWNRGERETPAPDPPPFKANSKSTALVLYSDSAESVEWVNMCWRKVGNICG